VLAGHQSGCARRLDPEPIACFLQRLDTLTSRRALQAR
jgi:hypothetical protein